MPTLIGVAITILLPITLWKASVYVFGRGAIDNFTIGDQHELLYAQTHDEDDTHSECESVSGTIVSGTGE